MRTRFAPSICVACREGTGPNQAAHRNVGTAGSVETASRASAARSEQANKANATTWTVIAEIQRAGKLTLAAIALGKRAACGPSRPLDLAANPGGAVAA